MEKKQTVTPWTAKGEQQEGKSLCINYDKIITQFGCSKITTDLITRLQNLSPDPIHHLIKRSIAFAHRDFNKILDAIENKQPIYLYTGRGPSSKSMHLGHAIPFMLAKYFQQTFSINLIIQITDDEKFLWKEMSLEEATYYGKENIKDIIAFGFDPLKTFIFMNTEYSHNFTTNILKIGKAVSYHEAKKVFGFDDSYSVSQIEFPIREIAPCFSSSFDFMDVDALCLVMAAVDQDPYFRLARDKAHLINGKKPASIYLTFLPDLSGLDSKMSASDINSCISLSDTPEIVKKKIRKYAFSGGKDTLEEHKKLGADINVDVSYHYLRFFMKDEERLEAIAKAYSCGQMTTSEIKKLCIDTVNEFLAEYQVKRKLVTQEVYQKFTTNK